LNELDDAHAEKSPLKLPLLSLPSLLLNDAHAEKSPLKLPLSEDAKDMNDELKLPFFD